MKSLIIKILIGLIATGSVVTIAVYGLATRGFDYNRDSEDYLSHVEGTEQVQSKGDLEETQENDEIKSKLIGNWSFSYEDGEYTTYTNPQGVTSTSAPVKYVYEFNFKENNEIEVIGAVDRGEVFAIWNGEYSIINSELKISLNQVLHPMDFTTDENGGIIDAQPEPTNEVYDFVIEISENKCELVSAKGENAFLPKNNSSSDSDIEVMVLLKQ